MGAMKDMLMMSYAHRNDPTKLTRFRQSAYDRPPEWAVDIKYEDPTDEEISVFLAGDRITPPKDIE
jgi:hypothetical protein